MFDLLLECPFNSIYPVLAGTIHSERAESMFLTSSKICLSNLSWCKLRLLLNYHAVYDIITCGKLL